MFSISVNLVTSATTGAAVPPPRSISARTADKAAESLPWTATLAPSLAKRRAIAAPIPRLAPVTIATRLDNTFTIFLLPQGSRGYLVSRFCALNCGTPPGGKRGKHTQSCSGTDREEAKPGTWLAHHEKDDSENEGNPQTHGSKQHWVVQTVLQSRGNSAGIFLGSFPNGADTRPCENSSSHTNDQ